MGQEKILPVFHSLFGGAEGGKEGGPCTLVRGGQRWEEGREGGRKGGRVSEVVQW